METEIVPGFPGNKGDFFYLGFQAALSFAWGFSEEIFIREDLQSKHELPSGNWGKGFI